MRLSTSVTALMLTGSLLMADEKPARQVSVRVYPVADLVARPPGTETSSSPVEAELLKKLEVTAEAVNTLNGRESAEESAVGRNLDELADVLRTVTVPDEWEVAGGLGRIIPYRKTMSLLVRQTAEGHAEIQDLLQQLRRENNIEIEITLEYLEEESKQTQTAAQLPFLTEGNTILPAGGVVSSNTPQSSVQPQQPRRAGDPNTGRNPKSEASPKAAAKNEVRTLQSVLQALAEKHGSAMDGKELAEFRKETEEFAETEMALTATVSNGRSRMLAIGTATSIISPDRRSVDFHLAFPQEYYPLGGRTRIPDGQTVVMRIPDYEGGFHMLLVTAKICVPEEEEELIVPALQPH